MSTHCLPHFPRFPNYRSNWYPTIQGESTHGSLCQKYWHRSTLFTRLIWIKPLTPRYIYHFPTFPNWSSVSKYHIHNTLNIYPMYFEYLYEILWMYIQSTSYILLALIFRNLWIVVFIFRTGRNHWCREKSSLHFPYTLSISC